LVGEQIRESLRIHKLVPRSGGVASRLFDRRRKAAEYQRVWQAMADVGIPVPRESARRFPHQFSGGMQQRALTAIALACEPKILLADEPTTALDVTIQAQILSLLDAINEEHGTAIIIVTHNLGVVAEFCENVIVMYAGQLMEKGQIDQIVEDPMHPYSRGLLRCLPRIGPKREQISPIPGLVPDLAKLPPGCPFAPRCAEAKPECAQGESIPLKTLPDGRLVRCVLY
jgi:oligopeptide/dipeptide ABC transporter ATP-binding protein